MPVWIAFLVMLLAWLMYRGEVNPDLAEVAQTFSRHLGLLFVPAAVGVVLFLPELRAHALAILAALVVSVVLTLAASALVLKWLSGDQEKLDD